MNTRRSSDGDRRTTACCNTFGKTWGKGIGPPPAGCSGPACSAGAGNKETGAGGKTKAVTKTPAAAALLGDVATTTVVGKCAKCPFAKSGVFPVGENIYGPYEAGFTEKQDFILAGLGCGGSPEGSLGRLDGGIDTALAEKMVEHQCNVTLPRTDSNGNYISLLDECGGHTKEYHFHERLGCLYETKAGSTHSTQVGKGSDGKGLYGKWEDYSKSLLPKLDACGGHFGTTPDSAGKKIYHYHIQDKPPFTIGCYGPDTDADGNMKLVSLATCRKLYSTVKAKDGSVACGSGQQKVTTKDGTIDYDNWCPCYDADGSSIGTKELPVFSDTAAVTCKTSDCIKTGNPSSVTNSASLRAGIMPLTAAFALLVAALLGGN